jgi:hypothetical protein
VIQVPMVNEERLERGRLCQPAVRTENVTEWR